MNGSIYRISKIRIFWVVLFITAGLALVLYNLYKIQIADAGKYQERAALQQSAEVAVSAQRGKIYDRNYQILASNAPVEQIFIEPPEIESDEQARLIARGLSEILGADYEDTYARTQWIHRRDVNIKHYVEIDKANEVREFKDENKIKAIKFRPQTKRVYPHSSLAAHVIGFTGTENNEMVGRFGVEFQYDEYLAGIPGKIITAKNALGRSLGSSDYSTYVEAQNGSNVVLSIDFVVQSFLEKNLEAAFAESLPRERVTGIIMDVHTGEILAMANYPSYDLNDPRTIDPMVIDYINLDAATLAVIEKQEFESEEDKNSEILRQKLFKMWQNKAISEAYEPGSTLKAATFAMGLEEKAVGINERFFCPGHYTVSGVNISCHQRGGHGSVSWAESLMKSCNPVTMQTAERIGAETFLKYFNAFGYNQRTGIDLPSEAGSIMHRPENFKTVELATASFGQRFKITPIQLLTSIAAVANGGKVVTPRVVRAIVDDDGNIIKSFEPEIKRMVISQDTSESISKILAEGVSGGGSARNAFVKGYEIAAKTGTSEKEVGTDARIGSCVAFAPAGNPQIAMVVIVDEPTGNSVYGGVISAPFVGRTLADVLPYLGIEPAYTEQEIEERLISVTNYRMRKIDTVKEDITSRGLKYTVFGSGDVVREQIPNAGSSLIKGGNVILYTDEIYERQTVEVPDVTGMSAADANAEITGAGLNINIRGAEGMSSSASATEQNPAAGETVKTGTIVTVDFIHASVTD
ncbi:MAG: penicillin-binding transpeptidase domain-containing protein [Oscillospiraceae bacterium]|nr:penicillin-binding transpeptidase domain-containing protein [Oscillospiraceae bacterium]